MADKKNEILTTYVSDVHALVAHGLTAIDRQVEQLKDVSHKDAEPTVVKMKGLLEGQKVALEARIKELGGSTTGGIKDVASVVAGAAAGVIDKVRPAGTVKNIRDDYTFFGMLNVSWLMLHTTATSLGDTATAMIAERGYSETAGAIMLIDRVLPRMVVEELGEEKSLHPTDTSAQCQEMIKKAWNREAASMS